MSKVLSEVEERYLECDLTEQELLDYGRENANQIQTRSSLESEKKAYNSRIKSEVDACTESIEKLSLKISTKKEHRHVDCRVIKDYDNYKISVVRLDTNEEISNRAMNKSEKGEVDDLFFNERIKDTEWACDRCGDTIHSDDFVMVDRKAVAEKIEAFGWDGDAVSALRKETYRNICSACAEELVNAHLHRKADERNSQEQEATPPYGAPAE